MRRNRRFAILAFIGCVVSLTGTEIGAQQSEMRPVRIGSKTFPESAILGEMAAALVASIGLPAEHKSLGDTLVLFKALGAGEIDVYPEYTGTISEEILAGQGIRGNEALDAALGKIGVRMTRPIGFNNSYVLGMKETSAAQLGVKRISDLAAHPNLRLGFSIGFMNRADGWPHLRARYQLPHQKVQGLEHNVAYRAIDTGTIDVTDLYATDAEIEIYSLRRLQDDLGFFPAYHAVLLYRAELAETRPEVVAALRRLEGLISAHEMTALNARVVRDKERAAAVAADFLVNRLSLSTTVNAPTAFRQFLRNTSDHLFLVAVSLALAILVAVPIGLLAARYPTIGQAILAVVGIVQTIPSLVLFLFMIPVLGTGGPPAVAALFLYSLLPIVRNTYAGMHDISPPILESAEALGLSSLARLWHIELPLAARSILAGIKTSAVINVGTATLGAFIGTGGYGRPIFDGITRGFNLALIMQGAIPAAVLALAVQWGCELTERLVVPKGLRLKPTR
jgi:osmoprotectant transport system permease protein